MPIDFGLEVPSKGAVPEKTIAEKGKEAYDTVRESLKKEEAKKEESKDIAFTDKDVEQWLSDAEKGQLSSYFNCLVIGADGTGKSGIIMSKMKTLPKKNIIIDLDGGDEPLKLRYYNDAKNIIIVNPLVMETVMGDIILDYKQTFAKIKAIIKYVHDHHDQFSSICLDGISTLLKYAEYQMRIDKNIAPDGGVQMRYWINRSKTFIEVLECLKHIPNVSKFLIGHEDFILKEDSAAVKAKTNQMIHQRIICRKVESKDQSDEVQFVAKIDKSKYNILLEGKEIVFAQVKGDKFNWNCDKVFEGLG